MRDQIGVAEEEAEQYSFGGGADGGQVSSFPITLLFGT